MVPGIPLHLALDDARDFQDLLGLLSSLTVPLAAAPSCPTPRSAGDAAENWGL